MKLPGQVAGRDTGEIKALKNITRKFETFHI